MYAQAMTVSAVFLQPILAALDARGVRTERFLAQVGLLPEHVQNTDLHIPFHQLLDAWQLAIEATNDPLLPLFAATLIHPAHYGVMGPITMSAPTLGEALALGARFEHLINRSFRTEVAVQNNQLHNRLVLPDMPKARLRPVVEFDFAAAVVYGHFLLNDRDRRLNGDPLEIHFNHGPAGPIAAYQDAFRCPVLFHQGHNEMVLTTTVMAQPLHSANPSMLKLLLTHADELGAAEHGSGLVAQIEQIILPQLPYGLPELKDVAELLHMSASTLKRRLQHEDTNYQSVCDSLRRRLAQAHVRETDKSFTEIAFLLGFSDLSTFYRAFKRWTEQTPQQFRLAKVV